MREGMVLAAAQARYGSAETEQSLQVLDRNPGAERQVQARLLQLAENVTPLFEDVAPGLLALDFTGLQDPYFSAMELASGADRLGLKASVAVSRNRSVALCAARTQRGITHVYPGQEAGFLKALPLDTLPLDSKALRTLRRWGVRRVGELALLPLSRMAERFGERGVRMVRLARGEEESLLRPCQPETPLELSGDFDWEIGAIEPLVSAMSGMIEQLCHRLQSLDRATGRLTTRWRLAGGGVIERIIRLPYPLSDARTLLTLVRIDLAAHPLGDAVSGVQVSAESTERQVVQTSLFESNLPDAETLAVTLARLSSLIGEERVGAPVALDTHRPGAAALEPFQPAMRGRGSGCRRVDDAVRSQSERSRLCGFQSATPLRSSLVFRCFRPSCPAEVTLRGDRPLCVEAHKARGVVTACAGPWRVAGEWWTPDGWQYQEWDIEVAGRLYRACCERATGEWFLAGEYD